MYILLGNTGFIGKNVEKVLREKSISLRSFSRPQFDLTDPSTFEGVIKDESGNVTFIDAMARIDGSYAEITAANETGFKNWIDFLVKRQMPFRYIYFSSYSTQLPAVVESNVYVQSKLWAENYLAGTVNNYKIIRLAFPFGSGESPSRLISRLISKIRQRESITIDDFTANFTPIQEFNADILDLIRDDSSKEINYASSNTINLTEIVDAIYAQLQLQPNYTLTGNKKSILVSGNYKTHSDKSLVFSELKSMLSV